MCGGRGVRRGAVGGGILLPGTCCNRFVMWAKTALTADMPPGLALSASTAAWMGTQDPPDALVLTDCCLSGGTKNAHASAWERRERDESRLELTADPSVEMDSWSREGRFDVRESTTRLGASVRRAAESDAREHEPP